MAGRAAYFCILMRSRLTKGPPGSDASDAVPSRTKRPDVVTGRVIAVPSRLDVMARSRLIPVPLRVRPDPGRAKPDSGRPPVEVGRTAGDGPPAALDSGRVNEVPGRATCAVELSSSSISPSPSSGSSPSSIQFLLVSARHLIHHTCVAAGKGEAASGGDAKARRKTATAGTPAWAPGGPSEAGVPVWAPRPRVHVRACACVNVYKCACVRACLRAAAGAPAGQGHCATAAPSPPRSRHQTCAAAAATRTGTRGRRLRTGTCAGARQPACSQTARKLSRGGQRRGQDGGTHESHFHLSEIGSWWSLSSRAAVLSRARSIVVLRFKKLGSWATHL
jgi:hypothetical protein